MTLNSDELGEKGESRFKELCADAKLICNKSDRDRTGWDYLVEFPFKDTDPFSSLDKRPPALSCHIQLKTVWSTTNRFKMRLSSAERIAKEVKPTFIYVLIVNKELQFVGAYIFHITNNVLSKILKRLRKEQKCGNNDINKKFISFSIKSGKSIEPTGFSLRNEIELSIGDSMKMYIENKTRDLNKLGFGKNSHTAKVTFISAGIEEIVDAFLGLRDIEIKDFSSVEKRFGIELPILPSLSSGGTISIQPEPSSTCNIVLRKDIQSRPITIQGDVYSPGIPGLEVKHLKLLIKTPFFDLIFHNGNISIASPFKIDAKWSYPLSVWINLFSFIDLSNEGYCKFSIISEDLPVLSGEFEIKSPQEQKSFNQEVLEILDAAKFIIDTIGIPDNNTTITSLLDDQEGLIGAKAIIENNGNLSPLKIKLPFHRELSKIPKALTILYVNHIKISGRLVAYSAVATMEHQITGEDIQFVSTKIVAHDITTIHDTNNDLDRLVNKWKSDTGVEGVFCPTFRNIESQNSTSLTTK